MSKTSLMGKEFFSDIKYKFLSNSFNLLFSLVYFIVIPNTLNVEEYGNFQFIKSTFPIYFNLLTFGSSQAFFRYASSRKRSESYIGIQIAIVILILFSVLVLVGLLFILGFFQNLISNFSVSLFFVGYFYGASLWLSNIVIGFSDAKSLTKKTAKILLLVKALFFTFFIFLLFNKYLNLSSFLIFNILLFSFQSISILFLCQKFIRIKIILKRGKKYFKYHKKYILNFCKPIFIFTIISAIYDIFDFSFLQFVGGSNEQAYYGLGNNFTAISITVISAFIPIIFREFARNISLNIKKVIYLYSVFGFKIYCLVLIISTMISFNTDYLTNIFFTNNDYDNAKIPWMILAFLPVNTVFGQLSSILYFSSDRNNQYKNILFVNMIIGTILTLFFLSDGSFGLNLGATGLSIKKVMSQFISVNCLIYFNCKFLKINYYPLLIKQLLMLFYFIISYLLIRQVLSVIPFEFGYNSSKVLLEIFCFALLSIYSFSKINKILEK